MPFLGYDPRELGCFDTVEVPGDVLIPTTSGMSWDLYRHHNWVYNKLEIALSQGLACSPLGGRAPERYPVFIKPIYNFFGMGSGTCVAHSAEELATCTVPGCFWVEHLYGEHLSHDVVLREGVPVYALSFRGHPLRGRRFDYWETVVPPPEVTDYLDDWIAAHMRGYTGCLNLETLGGRIIEAHLRMGDIKRIPEPALLQAIVNVYAGEDWSYHSPLPEYYLLVLWGERRCDYVIAPEQLQAIRLQVELLDYYDPRWRHENPPGALRIAQLGCYDFERGRRARAALAAAVVPRPAFAVHEPATDWGGAVAGGAA